MNSSGFSLSIDLGTSSCKLSLLDPAGTVSGTASSVYPTHSPFSGWAEQDPEEWLAAVRSASHKLLRETDIDAAKISIIVLTSAAHIGVLIDKEGNSIRRALLWSDQRSKYEVAELRLSMGDEIFRQTFNQVSTTWTLAHFAWIKKNDPVAWQRIDRVALSKDYLLFHLTGRWITDHATAVSSMLCSAVDASWSNALCDHAGIDLAMLPEIRKASDIVGKLNQHGAELLGLPMGIPVMNGTLDSAMETFGAGALYPGDYAIRIGTAGGIHVIKDSPRPDRNLLTYPYLTEGCWYSQAGTSSAGSSVGWALEAAGQQRSTERFAAFDRTAAEAPPGSEGLFFHPYLSGERTPYWNADLRGTFSGISFRHKEAHFARAVLEGIAFSLCDALLSLKAEKELPQRIRVVGGGTFDSLLMTVLSSVLNRELLGMRDIDSSYGAALFGLTRTVGLEWKNLLRAENEELYRPDKKAAKLYESHFRIYRKYAKNLILMYDTAQNEGQP
jgi:xylulokinase